MADVTIDLLGADLVADAIEAVAGFSDSASADADTATTKAAIATTSAATATAQAAAANVTYNAILAAIAAGTLAGPYLTNGAADAAAAAGTLAANALCYVAIDSTQGGGPTIRKRVGTATSTTFQFAIGSVSNGFSTTVPVPGSTSFNQSIIVAPAPVSGMTNSIGGNDAVTANFQVSAGKFTQGPTAQPNYWDTVVGFGLNLSGSFTPVNTSIPSGSFRMESKFAQGGATDVFGCEYHIGQFAKDASSEFRVFSSFIPHEKSDWATKSGAVITGAQINLYDGSFNVPVQFDFRDAVTPLMNLQAGGGKVSMIIRGDTNNQPILQQQNKDANGYLNLPFYDNRNVLRFGGAQFLVSTMPTVSVNGQIASREVLELAPLAGGAFEYVLFNATVTGNFTGYLLDRISASGTYTATYMGNSHASGRLADTREGQGDIFTYLKDNSVSFGSWMHGRRVSDGAFVISNDNTGSPGWHNVAMEIAKSTQIVNLPAGQLNIAGTKVLGTQQAAIADLTGSPTLSDVVAKLNALLDTVRAHGLIAA